MRRRIKIFVLLVATLTWADLRVMPLHAQRTASITEPSIRLPGLDGQTYDVADLRGQVVLVSFGATWCTPCSAELFALEELKREYASRPVKFFWVSIESEAEVSNSALKRYVKGRKLTFPILRDPGKAVFTQFSPRVRLPMIVFFGKDGRVDAPIQFGMRSPPSSYKIDVRARLNKLLADSHTAGGS